MLLRYILLSLSKNKLLAQLAKNYGLRFGASRFVAGDTLEKAINVIKELNKQGFAVTLDYLGEFVENYHEANVMADQAIEAIKKLGSEDLHAQLSIKLTSLGLDISEACVMQNIHRILTAARRENIFVTIDMENYARCEKTLTIFKQARQEYNNVGTVIQAYLYRSIDDLKELNKWKANLRLVKGAYKESADVAFPVKKDVDENFKKLIQLHLLNGNFTAIATHDEQVIQFSKELIKRKKIKEDQFEFQMLYGIRPQLQLQLVKEGYKVRIYVPYGKDWYGYFMRRLAERPANIMFVLKGVFFR